MASSARFTCAGAIDSAGANVGGPIVILTSLWLTKSPSSEARSWKQPAEFDVGIREDSNAENRIERLVNIPEEAYQRIESAIAGGHIEGEIYLKNEATSAAFSIGCAMGTERMERRFRLT
jgi:hypothetical protein